MKGHHFRLVFQHISCNLGLEQNFKCDENVEWWCYRIFLLPCTKFSLSGVSVTDYSVKCRRICCCLLNMHMIGKKDLARNYRKNYKIEADGWNTAQAVGYALVRWELSGWDGACRMGEQWTRGTEPRDMPGAQGRTRSPSCCSQLGTSPSLPVPHFLCLHDGVGTPLFFQLCFKDVVMRDMTNLWRVAGGVPWWVLVECAPFLFSSDVFFNLGTNEIGIRRELMVQ